MDSPAELRIVPLGGLGRIGGNMMLYETAEDIVVLDCGVGFPNDNEPGVRYAVPDVTYLRERKGKLRGYVLTHGHEDHIGALPWVLPELPAPVWGTPFTLAMLESRLAEHERLRPDVHRIADGRSFQLGAIRLQPVPVTHSIPGAIMTALHTAAGVVLHTGDYKLDYTPPDGRVTDLAALKALGDAGVLAMLGDSTNAERAGHTWSEREVGEALAPLIAQARGRVVVTTFASNLYRLQAVIDASARARRKVLPAGRSVFQILQMGLERGFLHDPDDVVADLERYASLPRERVTVIASGCQGEPEAALARIATCQHPHVELEEGDTLIMSSRRIPGNERKVGAVVNNMLRQGVIVVDDREHRVHTSGHAMRDEQRKVLELVRPRYFVPVHGEYRHLLAHAELAKAAGLPAERVFLLETGEPLEVTGGNARRAAPVPSGSIYVDGLGVGDVDDVVLRDRKILSESGFVACVVQLDSRGRLVGRPQILTRGVVHVDLSARLLEACADEIEEALGELVPTASEEERAETVRLALRRFFRRELARKPLLLPLVLTVDDV